MLTSFKFLTLFRQEDAFADIPIDGHGNNIGRGWIPPNGSSVQSIQQWEKEYQSMMQKMRDSDVGGDELREIAKSEVARLRELRHNLFCRDYIRE